MLDESARTVQGAPVLGERPRIHSRLLGHDRPPESGQQLNRNQVGPAHGRVTALFNGQVFTGSPRKIPLLAHAQIQLEVGRPLVVPEKVEFPEGL
jgi:hypothetical protein